MNDTQLLDRMANQIAAWEQINDRRAIFLDCYALMTRNMLQALKAGRFADNAWVETLVHHFAGYYFAALDGYNGGSGRLPEVWREAHDLTRNPRMPALVHLLLGVNAHINCDLALTLDDLLRDEWHNLSVDARQRLYSDYLLVNTIIGETIDTVQDTVLERYSPSMNIIDVGFGSLDEWCTARLIRNWRNDVWQHALALIAASDPADHGALRRMSDHHAQERIRLVVAGGALGARVFGYPQRWLQRLKLI